MKSKISWSRVASSNLASSSKKSVIPTGMADFFVIDARFERSNATRTSVAGDGWTAPNLYFRPYLGENANKSG